MKNYRGNPIAPFNLTEGTSNPLTGPSNLPIGAPEPPNGPRESVEGALSYTEGLL